MCDCILDELDSLDIDSKSDGSGRLFDPLWVNESFTDLWYYWCS